LFTYRCFGEAPISSQTAFACSNFAILSTSLPSNYNSKIFLSVWWQIYVNVLSSLLYSLFKECLSNGYGLPALSPAKFAMNAEDMRSSAKLTLINPPQFSLTSNKVAWIIESAHYFLPHSMPFPLSSEMFVQLMIPPQDLFSYKYPTRHSLQTRIRLR